MQSPLLEAFDVHKDALRGFIAKRCDDPMLADDILHDVFLKIQAQPESKDVQYPKAYLYRIANNLLIDGLRRQSKQALDGQSYIDEQTDHISPEHAAEQAQKLNVVIQAVNELPEKTRSVFKMQRLQQMEKSAVANQLGISVNMVEKHLRKAVQYCRDKLYGAEN